MISHHHECIFVHIPKNAGQSIEHVFLNLLNLTWETRAPLLLRTNDKPELGPPRLAHLKAEEYVHYKYISPKMFENYFKFAFVRNPWSRMVSIYKHLGFDKKYEFKKFLLTDFNKHVYKKWHWFVCPQNEFLYTEKGDLLVDFVGRFEDLQNDFNHVCQRIGLPSTKVPHINKSDDKKPSLCLRPRELVKYALYSIKKNKTPMFSRWQDYYDRESIEFIADFYNRDIELFGYEFGANAVVSSG